MRKLFLALAFVVIAVISCDNDKPEPAAPEITPTEDVLVISAQCSYEEVWSPYEQRTIRTLRCDSRAELDDMVNSWNENQCNSGGICCGIGGGAAYNHNEEHQWSVGCDLVEPR